MAKDRLTDLVVILPGITGSVLQKDGKDLWAMSGQALFRSLTNLGRDLEEMVVTDDDPNREVLDDGIRATSVFRDTHLIPGLWKIDGYSAVSKLITDNFDVVSGTVDGAEPANFFEFPYDWRRDNRAAAARLKAFVDRKLPAWREYTGIADARVIFLVHSMGGLVARYYLEVLEGWPTCRALVSFGTPYRGSINAVGSLANGYKKLFIDLTEAMRSFKSVYQLLPIYPAVWADDRWQRVGEMEIPGLNTEFARDGLAFHREIEHKVSEHEEDADYLKDGYSIIPVVGVRQKTLQSARLEGGTVVTSRSLPDGVDELQDRGDGTVPRVSAVPIELSDAYRETFISERHSSLQANRTILDDLGQRIKQMQSRGHRKVRGSLITVERAGIALDLDDLYLADEPVEIRAELINVSGEPPDLLARVTAADGQQDHQEAKLSGREGGYEVLLEGLRPGLYRIEIAPTGGAATNPTPVHDVFVVME
jgi:pimeloyl-ACP methyl ester carboxylesterase